jgi:uncharacterized protein
MLDGGDGDWPSAQPETTTLGAGLERGEVPQYVVPGGRWQAARPAVGEEVLVSCVVAPGFDFADFTLYGMPAPDHRQGPGKPGECRQIPR